jgi:rRNA maturation endonuclease Nob1
MAEDKNPKAKKEKDEPQMRYQCLKCYKTFKSEQAALDCCGSLIQAWSTNYTRWGKQHWYGR